MILEANICHHSTVIKLYSLTEHWSENDAWTIRP